ncbi:MAG: hypothetical protein FD131_4236 [Rhodocyclaceae bacterium]|nr:MAG: hypothetical protein FD131_4236 [Rhodocyclaceae bacterium]
MSISLAEFMCCVDDSLIVPIKPVSKSERDADIDAILAALSDADIEDPPPVSVLGASSELAKEIPSGATQGFPVADVMELPLIVDPARRLEFLISELCDHRNYSAIRKEYCELSVVLNLQGRLAPAFRPDPKMAWDKPNKIFFEIHRDQVVIDCHWLHSKQEPVFPHDEKLNSLFDSSRPFSFDHAWSFASQKWRKEYRATEQLILTPRQQCQLAAMRGDDLEYRFDVALKGGAKAKVRVPRTISIVRQRLRQWCEKDKRVDPLGYERLWLARELLGAGASVPQVAELWSLMTGDELRDKKTVHDRLKKMDVKIVGSKNG